MKKQSLLKSIIALFAISMLVFISCEKEANNEPITDDLELYTESSINQSQVLTDVKPINSGLKSSGENEVCSEYKIYPLIASKHYWVGALVVWNDSEYMYASYWSWLPLKDFHLFAGNIEELPVNKKGNPKIGHFPFTEPFETGMHTTTFRIPLSDIPECPDIAAHAVFRNHTIWAKDCSNVKEFDGRRWGWWLENQCTEVCEEEKVIAAKVWLYDNVNSDPIWSVLYDADNALGADCGFISPSPANENNSWNLVDRDDNTIIVGTISLTWNGTSGEVLITPNEGIIIKRSHMFYGTQEEFNSYIDEEGCPDYPSWPYRINSWSGLEEHSYTIEK